MRDWKAILMQLANAIDAVNQADKTRNRVESSQAGSTKNQKQFEQTVNQVIGLSLDIAGAYLFDHEKQALQLERIAAALEKVQTMLENKSMAEILEPQSSDQGALSPRCPTCGQTGKMD